MALNSSALMTPSPSASILAYTAWRRAASAFAISLPFGRAEAAIAITVGGLEDRLDGGRALGAAEAAIAILVELFDHPVTPQATIFTATFAMGKRGPAKVTAARTAVIINGLVILHSFWNRAHHGRLRRQRARLVIPSRDMIFSFRA